MTLAGTWYNELGSTMELSVEDNVVTGTYTTAVGEAQGPYTLNGYTDPAPESAGSHVIGFAVLWNNTSYGNSHAVTTWSGYYQVDTTSEYISTMWLLTGMTTPDYDWLSTNVGQDIFTRTSPSQEHIDRQIKSGRISHPMKTR